MFEPNLEFMHRLRLQYEPTTGSGIGVDIIWIGGPVVPSRPAKRGRSTSPTLFQHLPAQIPQARCLVYEHDLRPGNLAISTIRCEAERLLAALENLREATSSVRHIFVLKISTISTHHGPPTLIAVSLQADRPILLIGHSLGGILIKNALVQACDSAHPIIQCVAGVVFLGTPHPENARTAKGFLIRLFDVLHADRSQTGISLESLSCELEKQETEFREILKRSLSQLDLVSFYETRPLEGPVVSRSISRSASVTNKVEVVGRADCILDPFVPIPLPSDHEVGIRAFCIGFC